MDNKSIESVTRAAALSSTKHLYDLPDKAALLALADRVEALDGPCRETDRDIWYMLNDRDCAPTSDPVHAPRYTASFDAAMTLVPPRLSKCWLAGYSIDGVGLATVGLDRQRNAATPAIALTAAAIRALANGDDKDE